MKHIGYVVKKFGPEHVGIGTDSGYTSKNAAQENKKIVPFRQPRTRWASLWPPHSLEGAPKEETQSVAWTNWPLFTVGMVQMGYSDDDIRKIIGGNAMRVARAALA